MKRILAVARRELLERKLIFTAAALSSLIPFLVPIARRLHGATAREARETTALLLAAGFAIVLAAVLGYTVISRDLSERRLGFYFSRPLSNFSIWAGKMGGAFLLAIAAAAVIWLPTLTTSAGQTVLVNLPWWTIWAVLGGAAFLVLLTHAAGIAIRSRSALLALDAISLLLGAAATTAIVWRLLRRTAWDPIRIGAAWLACVVAAGLVAAGIASVARGRTDIRSAHRALSGWLWASIAAAVAGFGGYTAWVLNPAPTDLSLFSVGPAARGTWISVNGQARGALAGFLFDTSTGAFLPAGSARPGWLEWNSPVFSDDGAHAAWFEPTGYGGPFDLVTVRLDASKREPRRTGFSFPSLPYDLLLSPDGARFVTISHDSLILGDLGSGRTVGAAKLPFGATWMTALFDGPDRLRVFMRTETSLDLLDYDAKQRTLSRTATISGLHQFVFFLNADGDRFLIRERPGCRLRLFDGHTGALLADLLEESPREPAWKTGLDQRSLPRESSWQAFLADGRIVFATADESRGRLRVFGADGTPGRTIDVPEGGQVRLPGEAAPGMLIVAMHSIPDWERVAIFVADVNSGKITKAADDLVPVAWFTPGSEATRLFVGPHRSSIVRFDVLTGERRVILAGRPHR